jgi:hypothetical protein
MPPIKLTDDELEAVLRAARPLAVRDRDPFLVEVAAALQSRAEHGPGDVHRAIVAAQRKFFDPPTLSPDEEGYRRRRVHSSKYG